ncbi:hypothetical protein B0O99DRAFT_224702 [Bisporella sp. PMI_857]|nr:hypothetical protein B0O99DRAFT_224702 [Bisporella sp. PMI_857]
MISIDVNTIQPRMPIQFISESLLRGTSCKMYHRMQHLTTGRSEQSSFHVSSQGSTNTAYQQSNDVISFIPTQPLLSLAAYSHGIPLIDVVVRLGRMLNMSCWEMQVVGRRPHYVVSSFASTSCIYLNTIYEAWLGGFEKIFGACQVQTAEPLKISLHGVNSYRQTQNWVSRGKAGSPHTLTENFLFETPHFLSYSLFIFLQLK